MLLSGFVPPYTSATAGFNPTNSCCVHTKNAATDHGPEVDIERRRGRRLWEVEPLSHIGWGVGEANLEN